VAELPELMEVAREYAPRGAQLLGLSYDLMIPSVEREEAVDKVRAFLTAHEFAFPTLIYDAPDFETIDARFELPGAIPVTLAFDRTGVLVGRHEGEATREQLAALMEKALGP